jgi:general stress protein 26
MTKEQLFTFIKDHKLAVLSTISAQGAPQSALIGIAVTAELEIVFDTVKSSRKYGNLATNPAATFVVGCTSETTLQYEGVASEPLGDDLGALRGSILLLGRMVRAGSVGRGSAIGW